MSIVLTPTNELGIVRRILAAIGRVTRIRVAFVLQLAALTWGVLSEAVRPSSWRRTVRMEFWRVLRQAAGGGLPATLFTAALAGLVMVSQALYWLGEAGEEGLVGPIIVTVLVREITPLLIGSIVLGRSGIVAMAELGALQLGGQVRVLSAQGIDMFSLLILPRSVALALATFALGVIFVLGALVVGFVAGSLIGAVHISIWLFFDRVSEAMSAVDFAVFPAKMLAIGLLVSLVASLTAFSVDPAERLAEVLPRAFVRGVMAIMFVSLALSLAA
ncbi:MAG TPA: ABC transporter permease [Stellaceae bacterium]|nr:ABC transporter permease [Stellaceae bacterium]